MARGSEEKATRRAQAQLDKALARRDPEGAVDAVLGLDKLARQPLLDPCASLFRRMLPELHRQAAWGRLHTLAARSEQEPRLVSQGADDEACARARWLLLLASMRARDFARAQRLWSLLEAWIAGRTPALSQALAAWVLGHGEVTPDALSGLDLAKFPEAAPVDPRLGHEPSARPHAPPPAAPATLGEVEDAVHQLFATQTLNQVGDILVTWLSRAQPEIAAAVQRLAGSLALHELLIRVSAHASIGEPAQLLVRLVKNAPKPEAMADEILLAIRCLLSRTVSGAAGRDERDALPDLLAALLRIPRFAAVADAIVRDLAAIKPLAPMILPVCERVLSHARDLPLPQYFALWARALSLHCPLPTSPDDEPERRPTPVWLQAASRFACERGNDVAAFLKALERRECALLVHSMVWGLPCFTAVDLFDAAWNDASDEIRREFAMQLDEIILDAEDASIDRLMVNPGPAEFSYLERMSAASAAADPGLPFIAADGLKIWRRLGVRALPFSVRLLPFALFEAKDPRRYLDAVKAHVGGRRDIEAWLDVIDELLSCDTPKLTRLLGEVQDHILNSYKNERPAIVRALIWSARIQAPLGFTRDLARAYEALPPPDLPKADADEKLAARIAAMVLRLGTKRRNDKPVRRKPKKPRKHDRGEQLDLPMGGLKP
jgi:hypothetical protein